MRTRHSRLVHPLLATCALAVAGASPAWAQDTFSNMSDLVPDRCFSAPLSTAQDKTLSIGIETGQYLSGWTLRSKGCGASAGSMTSFPRSTSDRLSVTINAPAGQRIARIYYQQAGLRIIERSTYWYANGSLSLAVDGVRLTLLNFQSPSLTQTLELSHLGLTTATVSVDVTLSAGRNTSNPRVTSAPGGVHYEVTGAQMIVEFEE